MSQCGKAPVRRVTVDECLDEGLARVLIADLAPNTKEFSDTYRDWQDERDVLVTPEDYCQKLGVTESSLPWLELREGRVFLVGSFKIVRRRGPDSFRVTARARGPLRIDGRAVVDQGVRELYSHVLRREEG